MPQEPIEHLSSDEGVALEQGVGLCLSGGGYRAMVFHVGVLWRLYQVKLLGSMKRISSVSGGSITSAVLGLKWSELFEGADVDDERFVRLVVEPIRELAGTTIDADAIITGLVLPGSVSDRVCAAYDEQLFKGATLQALPDQPRFVINATNVQTGALWRFMKPYMSDYRVGKVEAPQTLLAQAVAASSAFPPVLSPFRMKLPKDAVVSVDGADLHEEPFTTDVVLTDGGVYDNLGLETVWKRFDTVLVSDAGGKLQPEGEPKSDWARHAYRVLDLVDNQVRSLRKRQLIDAFDQGLRKGAYWGIRTNIADYPVPGALPCQHEATMQLAAIATRLKRLDAPVQEKLINWGYAVCDAALRSHMGLAEPNAAFPYPRGV